MTHQQPLSVKPKLKDTTFVLGQIKISKALKKDIVWAEGHKINSNLKTHTRLFS